MKKLFFRKSADLRQRRKELKRLGKELNKIVNGFDPARREVFKALVNYHDPDEEKTRQWIEKEIAEGRDPLDSVKRTELGEALWKAYCSTFSNQP